ncbi:MAG: CehA/McbA family metallohydrolase, partial [Pseudomonadota bacterium]
NAVVHFDAFRLDYRVEYPEIFSKQRKMLDAIAADEPDVVQHQGMELHVSRHLNEFSVHTEPPSFNGPLNDAVQAVHDRGGLVSYNHMFGAAICEGGGSTPESVLAELLNTRAYDTDLLEVGYRCRSGRELADYLWVWDQLTAAHLFLTGTGVSDDHNLAPGSNATRDNNFVSWIYADSPDKTDLIDGLRRGRVYFGDINLFDGHVDLSTPSGAKMGQVVFTDQQTAQLTIDIDGLAEGDEIRSIHNGELANTYTATGAAFSVTESLPLAASGSFARVEVYAQDGTAKAFSNPLHFVRRVGEEGVSPFRSVIDLTGAQSTEITGFSLRRATLRGNGRDSALILGGSGEQGTVVLEWSRTERPYSVIFQGLSGTWSFDGGLLTLSNLTGDGSLTVLAGNPGKGSP